MHSLSRDEHVISVKQSFVYIFLKVKRLLQTLVVLMYTFSYSFSVHICCSLAPMKYNFPELITFYGVPKTLKTIVTLHYRCLNI